MGLSIIGFDTIFPLSIGRFFLMWKPLIANNMFNPAGVELHYFGVNAFGDKLLRKKQCRS